MSWKSKAWAFAGTVAALEELRTKKLCPCNSSLESLHHHDPQQQQRRRQQAIQNMGPVPTQVQASSSSPPSSKKISKKRGKQETLDQSEESLRKIMYLSSWGPN